MNAVAAVNSITAISRCVEIRSEIRRKSIDAIEAHELRVAVLALDRRANGQSERLRERRDGPEPHGFPVDDMRHRRTDYQRPRAERFERRGKLVSMRTRVPPECARPIHADDLAPFPEARTQYTIDRVCPPDQCTSKASDQLRQHKLDLGLLHRGNRTHGQAHTAPQQRPMTVNRCRTLRDNCIPDTRRLLHDLLGRLVEPVGRSIHAIRSSRFPECRVERPLHPLQTVFRHLPPDSRKLVHR